ncbi:S9 family peptidase [Clostridium tyrobutyricum]|uniref:alpha/beta hydrolase n=1 Tax=Clostridium tyrobutyricum TaxID=1519 RepID=UPI001C393531|nr:alpha/beta fold hydrolase [Clostridium tyrobutyricum]MBV4417944.1 S9 family peptidase [Clostridium tyrobutyricum]
MQKSVEIESKELTLRGMLHVPERINGKIPIVCIFHGFYSDKTEAHFMFVKLSRKLADMGIASVRFDFRGSGESDGEFIDMTVSKELEDANAILDYAGSLDFVDINKIGVIGLSLGGAIASMLAGDRRETIKSLCLWAPAGNMRDIIIKGKSKDDVRQIRRKGFFDFEGLSIGTEFLGDIENIDIFRKASSYDKNVLIIHGDKDETVPLCISERYLELYGTNAVLHIVKGADHTFNSKEWEDEVLDCSIAFMETELL